MDSAIYATISRQSGLMREMQIVANNIANASTAGYRQEELVFSEHIHGADDRPLSMGHAGAKTTEFSPGAIEKTGGRFDLALEGDGFFLIETPLGLRLTRAGNFVPNGDGLLTTPDGFLVMDTEEAPIFVPATEPDVFVAPDGTISADGQPLSRIGIFLPVEPQNMMREDGVRFRADDGYDPAPEARVLQGFREGSNVNSIVQLTRMIEIQRAYEMGQSFLETEDERIRAATKILMK